MNRRDNDGPNRVPNPVHGEPMQNKWAFDQQFNYDRMASDRIGEELKPDAFIWRLYAEEAKEYDAEFTRERKESLSNMLLFAALFSAIVTAFLIESTNLLEQDSSEVSTQLLLALVQSQQRIETGTPNTTSSPVGIPEFAPSTTARAISVLWFTSLVISLGAAVVALLAREWLSAFTSYRTRHAHDYALERHSRLRSLGTWNMLPIIDLLPTSMNFALFVFFLGLVIRLWLLDLVVAGVITIITTAVCSIYLFFVISGAAHQACPYKSQLSTYIQRIASRLSTFIKGAVSPRILKYFVASKSSASHAPKCTVPEQINLLVWLLDNSSDPMLRNYITQALAGLRSFSLGLPTINKEAQSLEPHNIDEHNSKVLTSLFDLGVQVLDQLQMAQTRGPDELVPWRTSSITRHIIAMSEIIPHALTWQLWRNTLQQPAQDNTLITDMENAGKITENIYTIFEALDRVMDEAKDKIETGSCPLPLGAYIYLTTVELEMVTYTLAFLAPCKAKEKLASLDNYLVEMNASFDVRAKISGLNQVGLQERQGRALSRIACVIERGLGNKYDLSPESQLAIVDFLSQVTKPTKYNIPDRVAQDGTAVNDTINVYKIMGNVFGVFSHFSGVPSRDPPKLMLRVFIRLVAIELKMVRGALESLGPCDPKQSADLSHNPTEMDASIDARGELPMFNEAGLRKYPAGVLCRTAVAIESSLGDLKDHPELQSALVDMLLEATEFVRQLKLESNNTSHQLGTGSGSIEYRECRMMIQPESGPARSISRELNGRNLELMEILVELCMREIDEDTLRLEGFQVAAFNLILVFWPAYLQQRKVDKGSELPSPEVQEGDTIPLPTTPYNPQISAEIIVYQSIVLTHVVMGLWEGVCAGWEDESEALKSILRVFQSQSSTLLRITKQLGGNIPGRVFNYDQWLPTNETLAKWIQDTHRYPGSYSYTDYLSRWIAHLVAMTTMLPRGVASLSVDVFARFPSAHSAAYHDNVTSEEPMFGVDYVMEFIYAAWEAIDRDAPAPEIGCVLDQVTSYIKRNSSSCHVCLRGFTEKRGFHILAEVGKNELVRVAVAATVRAVLAKLYTAQLPVNGEIIPPFFEAMSLIRGTDIPQPDRDSFVLHARFQLQRSPSSISGLFVTPFSGGPSPIQKLAGRLERWPNESTRPLYADFILSEIASLRDQAQKYADQLPGGSSDPTGGALDSQESVQPGIVLPEPQTAAANSGSNIEADPPAQSSHNPVLPAASDRAQSIRSTSSIVHPGGAGDGPSSPPNEASGSGQTRPTLPAELVALPESDDESSDEEQSTN